MPNPEIRPLYYEGDAARLLGVPARALRSEREAGRITFRRVSGRIMYRADDLTAWQEEIACRDHREGRSSSGTGGGAASGTSPGRSGREDAPEPGSVQRARATARRLIESSRHGSRQEMPSAPSSGMGHVVPLKQG